MALPTRISNTILRTTVSQRWDVLLIPEVILTRKRQDAEEDAEENNLFFCVLRGFPLRLRASASVLLFSDSGLMRTTK